MKNKRPPRFHDVDWTCDYCSAYLNSQSGFDDHKRIWKCKKCGHLNVISADNIQEPHYGIFTRIATLIIGIIRTIQVYKLVNTFFDCYIFESKILGLNFNFELFLYIVLVIGSVLFEIFIPRALHGFFRTITEPFFIIVGDVLRPFDEIIKFFRAIIDLFKYKSVKNFFVHLFYCVIYSIILYNAFITFLTVIVSI